MIRLRTDRFATSCTRVIGPDVVASGQFSRWGGSTRARSMTSYRHGAPSPAKRAESKDICMTTPAASRPVVHDGAAPPCHPSGMTARILLTSAFGPYAQDDEYGCRAIDPVEQYRNQVTRATSAVFGGKGISSASTGPATARRAARKEKNTKKLGRRSVRGGVASSAGGAGMAAGPVCDIQNRMTPIRRRVGPAGRSRRRWAME